MLPSRDAERLGRLLVREPGDVDGDQDVAEIIRERGDGGVELAGLERGLRLARPRIGHHIKFIVQRTGSQPAARRTPLGQERVA